MKREQCPKCASIGKDRSQDNLAVYPDGSKYCFSCGYFKSSKNISYKINPYTEIKNSKVLITLPSDLTTNIPKTMQEYLLGMYITPKDIINNFIHWSPSEERICFPIFVDGEYIGWQGRSLTRKPKWYSQGIDDKLIYLTNNTRSTVVLVEDIISAINVGKQTISCCCLFGSNLSLSKMQALSLMGKDKFILWLDKDKERESIKRTEELRYLGFNCYSLTTDKDPKYYSQEDTLNILTNYK
jgi:hypothetical protein